MGNVKNLGIYSQKGNPGSNKGKKFTKEWKDKIKKNHKGMKGKRHSNETKEKIRKTSLGRNVGEKSGNWAGGISKCPYPIEFNKTLKLKIRTRDNFTCCLCGKTEREELEELNRVLCVNHIDFNKQNCSEKNLNTLCLRCNIKINRERDYWTNYFMC